jgi:hypothetical protein
MQIFTTKSRGLLGKMGDGAIAHHRQARRAIAASSKLLVQCLQQGIDRAAVRQEIEANQRAGEAGNLSDFKGSLIAALPL